MQRTTEASKTSDGELQIRIGDLVEISRGLPGESGCGFFVSAICGVSMAPHSVTLVLLSPVDGQLFEANLGECLMRVVSGPLSCPRPYAAIFRAVMAAYETPAPFGEWK